MILLETVLNSHLTFDEIVSDKLAVFLKEKCADYKNSEDFTELINRTEIKNTNKNDKKLKFTQKLHAFVYACLIDFQSSNIVYETITTTNLFQNVNHIVKVKTHLHYSYVTGEILGYVHNSCNWRLQENKTALLCFAYNFFGFDISFLIQGFRATA